MNKEKKFVMKNEDKGQEEKEPVWESWANSQRRIILLWTIVLRTFQRTSFITSKTLHVVLKARIHSSASPLFTKCWIIPFCWVIIMMLSVLSFSFSQRRVPSWGGPCRLCPGKNKIIFKNGLGKKRDGSVEYLQQNWEAMYKYHF